MPYRTTTALLRRAQRLGLSHAAAVQFVDDYPRLFGHHRFNGALATPDDWAWRRLRDRLQRAWTAVRSMADWNLYAASSDRRAFRWEVDGIWSMFGPGDDDDPDPHRQRMQKADGWDGLWHVARGHAWPDSTLFKEPPGPKESVPAGSRRRAEARLQRTLMQCGLRGLSWPVDQPANPAHLNRLSDLLLDAQRVLQERTGWDGPVLGLGGFLHLALDAHLPLSGPQAFFSWRRNVRRRDDRVQRLGALNGTLNVRLIMVLSLRSGMTAFAHEWFHALDSLLAISAGDTGRDGVSEQWKPDAPFQVKRDDVEPSVRQAVDALNGFTRAFIEGPMPEHVVQAAAQEARDRWLQGFVEENDPPLYQAVLVQEDRALRAGTWSAEDALPRWQQAVQARFLETGLVVDPTSEDVRFVVTYRAGLAAIQDRLLREGGLSHPEGQPFWTAVQNLLSGWQVDHGLGAKWAGYPRLPHEMLAHAFESSFARPDLRIVETRSGHGTLRFPTGAEAAFHAPAWAALFEALRPWWNGLRDSLPTDPPVGPRE